ncbi:secreted RxLR effector protein 161-like [Medicago truncatula]|uniref:secreted RxLR effector protein 161-like n=1 Tax=Medicago truncatula TaxID=3880 RepID=UPI00196858C9|nr:secreted RxLR effector protein 161-like [Medicago truncatula]
MLDFNSSITLAYANNINEVKEEDKGVDPTILRRLIGLLRYLCQSRLDISYSVGIVSKFMSNPLKTHFLAAKKIIRYIHGTLQYGILFPEAQETEQLSMIDYSDADWCRDKRDRRRTTSFLFMLQGAPISWSSKKQPIVALSSCEVEYVVGSSAACQANWLQNVLEQSMIKLKQPIKLLIDNKYAINLAKNHISHGKSKHIETKFHYLRDQVNKCKINIV